nr:heme ABC transporter ATP-binding protein [Rubritepida flocculans]
MILAGGLVVRRGGRRILDLPDLAIAPGRVTGILGANGAGKSTLLRVLSGELRPEAGRAFLDGVPVLDWPADALARRRAVLPQSGGLGFPLRVAEVVALGRLPHAGRASRAEDRAALAAAMQEADVAHLAQRFFASLSGGEQQRVQLARVLAQLHGPPPERTALFLDEPTAALDLAQQHAVLRAAERRARAGGLVVVVLHDLALAARYCERVLLLHAGRRLAEGPPAEALSEAAVGEAYGLAVRRIATPCVPAGLFLPAEESAAPGR